MSGEGESFALDIVFVDRSSDENVDFAFAQFAYGAFEGGECGLTGNGCSHTRLNAHVFAYDVNDRYGAVASVGSRVDLVELKRLHIHSLAVESCNLGRTVDYRCAQLKDTVILQHLQDYLVADAVSVSVGDSHLYFMVAHIG